MGGLLVALAVLAVVLVYLAALAFTYLMVCTFFGCRTGGHVGYSPVAGQVLLLVCGVLLVPLPLIALGRRQRAAQRIVAALAAFVLGSGAAMLLAEIGPNGCSWGYEQAVAPTGTGLHSITCKEHSFTLPSR